MKAAPFPSPPFLHRPWSCRVKAERANISPVTVTNVAVCLLAIRDYDGLALHPQIFNGLRESNSLPHG